MPAEERQIASGYVDFATTAAPMAPSSDEDSENAPAWSDNDSSGDETIPDVFTPQQWKKRTLVLGTNVSEAKDLIIKIVEAYQHEEWKVPTIPKDDPRIHVASDTHAQLSWTQCYFDLCHRHLFKKIEYKWFPDRAEGAQPIRKATLSHEYIGWVAYLSRHEPRELTLVPPTWAFDDNEVRLPPPPPKEKKKPDAGKRNTTPEILSFSSNMFTSSGSKSKDSTPEKKDKDKRHKKNEKSRSHRKHSKNESNRK
jgi:hypothetical protein